MTHTIKLKYGSPAGWAYIDLTDAQHGNVDYVPGTPGEGAEEIVESGRWRVAGDSVTDLIGKITEIETVLYRAGQFGQDGIGAYQARLTVQLEGVIETWESPIYEGRLELGGAVMGGEWANRETDVTLIWRRAGWWERYVAVPLSNANGTNVTTAGLQVSNSNDGTGSAPTKLVNYVDIKAQHVPGDLPAPAVFEVSTGARVKQIWTCLNAKSLPGTLVYQAEGETGSSDTTDATRSAGKYHTYTVPAGASGLNITLATSNLSTLIGGAWLRFMASAKFTGTVKITPYLSINGVLYYGPGSIVTNAGTWQVIDLGLTRLPPVGIYDEAIVGAFYSVSVGINVINAAGLSFDLDYLQFCPCDGYAVSKVDLNPLDPLNVRTDCRGGNVNVTAEFDSTGGVISVGTLYGGIWLEPGIAQRMVFKFLLASNADTLSTSPLVRLFCWARKRTL